jgi:hypothetical protein
MRVKVIRAFAIHPTPPCGKSSFNVGDEVDDSEFGMFGPEIASSVVPVTPEAPARPQPMKGTVTS